GVAVGVDYQSLDPGSGRLYISHMNAGQLVVFDTRERKVVANLDGFASVRGVWVVPQLKRVYAAARGSHQVIVVDSETLQIAAKVGPVPDPDGIAYAPTANRVFVSDEASEADAVIDASRNSLVASITLGGEGGNTGYGNKAGPMVEVVAEAGDMGCCALQS